jgi:Ca-activated chloride channel family protein
MRCLFCGLLQDEPKGVKACARCGGELAFEQKPPASAAGSYVQAQMELDQISAPAGRVIDRYLIVTIETPSEIPDDEAAPTASGRESMGFSAALDVSGSMRGTKLDTAKDAVRQAVRYLHDGDTFSLVTFAHAAQTVLEPTRVDRRLREKVDSALNKIQAGGQTALCDGLEAGIEAASSQAHETNLVLLLSDGQANVGETNLEKVGALAHQAHQNEITTSTLGVGRDYNEALMVEIAVQGGGRFYHVRQAHQITPYVAGELGEVSALAARDTTLHLTLPAGTGLQTLSSAYTVGEQFTVNLGDIPLDTQLEIAVRLLLPPQSRDSRLPIEGHLSYRSPANNDLSTPLNVVTLRFVAPDMFNQRDATVAPVVKRVLEQMQARSVLGTTRMLALEGRSAADDQYRLDHAHIRAYASQLGDDVARELAEEHEHLYAAMQTGPDAAKSSVSHAYQRQHGTKDFGKKK